SYSFRVLSLARRLSPALCLASYFPLSFSVPEEGRKLAARRNASRAIATGRAEAIRMAEAPNLRRIFQSCRRWAKFCPVFSAFFALQRRLPELSEARKVATVTNETRICDRTFSTFPSKLPRAKCPAPKNLT